MRRGLRLATMRAVALTVLGALLFGLLGSLYALRAYPTYSAALQMRVYPDPALRGDDPTSNVPVEEFLAGELLLLNDEAEAEATPTEDDDAVTVTQLGSTNVLEVVALADTRDGAVRGAQAVLDRYADARKQALEERVEGVSAEVQSQLVATTARIRALAGDTGVTAAVNRDALTAEYTRLLAAQNELESAAASSDRLVQTVRPATLAGTKQVVSPLRTGVLFAVLGSVVGLAGALALSRWRRWVTGLDDVLELAPELALPTVPHLGGTAVAARSGQELGLHVSALTGSDGLFAQPPLIVVAPTEGAGATTVAVGLAVASARRGQTVLVGMGDAVDGAAARLLGVRDLTVADEGLPVPTDIDGLSYVALVSGQGAAALAALQGRGAGRSLSVLRADGVSVVIDAPALARSPVAFDLARAGGQVLLVGGVEHTTSAELKAAAASLHRVGARLVGVVLSTPRRGLLRRRARPTPPPVPTLRRPAPSVTLARRRSG